MASDLWDFGDDDESLSQQGSWDCSQEEPEGFLPLKKQKPNPRHEKQLSAAARRRAHESQQEDQPALVIDDDDDCILLQPNAREELPVDSSAEPEAVVLLDPEVQKLLDRTKEARHASRTMLAGHAGASDLDHDTDATHHASTSHEVSGFIPLAVRSIRHFTSHVLQPPSKVVSRADDAKDSQDVETSVSQLPGFSSKTAYASLSAGPPDTGCNKIILVLRWGSSASQKVKLKVAPSEPLSKVFDAFKSQVVPKHPELQAKKLTFTFDEDTLDGGTAAEAVGMENEDVVDVKAV